MATPPLVLFGIDDREIKRSSLYYGGIIVVIIMSTHLCSIDIVSIHLEQSGKSDEPTSHDSGRLVHGSGAGVCRRGNRAGGNSAIGASSGAGCRIDLDTAGL